MATETAAPADETSGDGRLVVPPAVLRAPDLAGTAR
jgi:hypothetical protein